MNVTNCRELVECLFVCFYLALTYKTGHGFRLSSSQFLQYFITGACESFYIKWLITSDITFTRIIEKNWLYLPAIYFCVATAPSYLFWFFIISAFVSVCLFLWQMALDQSPSPWLDSYMRPPGHRLTGSITKAAWDKNPSDIHFYCNCTHKYTIHVPLETIWKRPPLIGSKSQLQEHFLTTLWTYWQKPAVLRDRCNEERTSAKVPEYIVSLSFLPVLSYATLLSDILKRFVNFNHRAAQKSSWKSLIVEYRPCMWESALVCWNVYVCASDCLWVYCKPIGSPTSTRSPTVSGRESHRYSWFLLWMNAK